jgi:1-deoxy-D-xylulose-5-phosphate reductoisomerase
LALKKIAILGATGSLGTQALDIAREFREDIEVVCLTAHTNYVYLAEQANEFRPPVIALTGGNGGDVDGLAELLDYDAEVISGKDALVKAVLASGCDLVLLAVLGIAGCRRSRSASKRV